MFQYMDKNYCVLGDTFITWSGTESVLKIPNIFNGNSAKRIGDGAFSKCDSLREVYIGEGYEVIGMAAFERCKNLEKVYIPDSVKVIEAKAFYKCEKLKVVRMSQAIEEMNGYVFEECISLKEIHLPSTISSMMKGEVPIFPDGSICDMYVHFTVNRDAYKAIASKTLVTGSGKMLLTDTIDELDWLSTLKFLNRPNHIDESMHGIFLVDQPMIDVSPDMRRTLFSWEGVPDMSKEDTVIKKLIESGSSSFVNDIDEAQWVSDCNREAERLPRSFLNRRNELCFCVLENTEVSADGNNINGTIKVYRTYGFFISVHRILHKQKYYYLYSRNYLVGNKMAKSDRVGKGTPIYYRNDMAIYSESGLVSDRRLSEEIYAKYKLFSIL